MASGTAFNFITAGEFPGCPICESVLKAFIDYLSEAPVASGPDTKMGWSDIKNAEPLERIKKVSVFVQKALQFRLERLSSSQRLEYYERLHRAAKKGMEALEKQQQEGVERYELMWSCQMCDAAVRSTVSSESRE